MLKALRRRLAGDVPLAEAIYHDMLAVGSMVNIAISLCAFAMIAADFPIWRPVVVFFSPQPYNIILVLSILRSASRSQGRGTDYLKAGAFIWFVVMFFV